MGPTPTAASIRCPKPAFCLTLPTFRTLNPARTRTFHARRTQICSICEEAWLSTALEEHSIHCAVLRTLSGNGLSVDAQLTTIANVLEEWLETPMAFPALGPAPSQYHTK